MKKRSDFFEKYKTLMLWVLSVLIFFAVIVLYFFACFILSKFTVFQILFSIISIVGGLFVVCLIIAIIHEILKDKFD